jgi:hypothetical protein
MTEFSRVRGAAIGIDDLPAKPANGRRRMANKLELLAISAHAPTCNRSAGGPLGGDAGTLE